MLTKEDAEEILNDSDFRFSDYFRYRSSLGQGSFGYVVLAVSKTTLETMAVKVLLHIPLISASILDYREMPY